MTGYSTLRNFIIESNSIEGLNHSVSNDELEAYETFMKLPEIAVENLEHLVSCIQPGASLRRHKGMNVIVGAHRPIDGGPDVEKILRTILKHCNERRGSAKDAYQMHKEYETLHPFMDGNGRSGRALWLWMMGGYAPLGFLHHWYYQTLQFDTRR